MWHSNQKEMLIGTNEPELKNLRVLFTIYTFFVCASIVMPQYFGVHIGYDITCARLSNLLFIGYIVFNPKILTHFFQTVVRCEVIYPLCLYLFVAGYTMVLRADVNAFFLVFLEFFSLCMMIYGIRYVLGYQRAIKMVIGCSYFLGFYGLLEFVYGKSIFLQFLSTVPNTVKNSYRSGHYRVMGPCGHSLGYGMVLLLFIAFACIDLKKNEVYLFKRPVLLVVLYMNVFLTGSRSALAISMLEMLVILLFSNRKNIKKSIWYLIVALVSFSIIMLFIYKTGIGQYVMGQITSVIDQVLGTNYSTNFGVETDRLKDSTEYRKVLPKIFTLDWLNPLVGRGRDFGGAEIDGVFVHSIDNYYVAQYIKYAYPGMISYILFMVVLAVVLIRDMFIKGNEISVVTKVVFIGCVHYFINLWWVDALQTLKYVYIVIAIYYAAWLEGKDKRIRKAEER